MSGRASVILSQKGVEFIQGFESFSETPYKCPAGRWTNGWGHTRGVTEYSPPVDLETATDNFFDDVELVETELDNIFDGVELEQNEWDALVSLCFNLRGGPRRLPLEAPKLVAAVKAGEKEAAAREFLDICHAKIGGKDVVLEGLVKRRRAEAEMFLGRSLA